MKKIDYFWPRTFLQITGIVFLSQLFMEILGLRIEFDWVIYVCAITFFISLVYAFLVIILNSRRENKNVNE
jgi:hypothetical protein